MDSKSVKEEIMRQVRQEFAIDAAKQLIEKVNKHCFERCVPKPGASLSNSEQTCFTQCMDKYMASWAQVSTTYMARLQREQ